MRDILLTVIVFGSIPFILKKPYIGILVWSWLSYMNPHRMAFGFAHDMPFAQIIAIVLFISILFSGEQKKFFLTKITGIWIVFIIWMGITTVFAYFPDQAYPQYLKIIKIQVITFLTVLLITDIERLNKLIWVIVFSIGFFSVKGGVFTILSGGSRIVWGPPGGYIEENNALAVGILMIIPLIGYLYKISNNGWIKKGLLLMIILSFFTVLGSQSRGALIAISSVGFFFWFKSKRKIFSGLLIAIIAVALFNFMPESWHQRMQSINTYEEDTSAMGRLNAWEYAFNAANDNLFGVGLESWSYETFAIYAPNPTDMHAAHSIYFSVLADHGWIGLFFYLGIYYLTWRLLVKIIKKTNGHPEQININILCKMLQVSLIAYLSGGAFLSLSYFDLPWHIVSFVIIIDQILKRKGISSENTIFKQV